MRSSFTIRAASVAVLLSTGYCADAASTVLTIERGVSFGWPTMVGNAYQPQWAPAPAGPWTHLGVAAAGSGTTQTFYDATAGSRTYRVLEVVPGSDPIPASPVNSGFEAGSGIVADHWTTGGGQPPVRTGDAAHLGSWGMRCALANVGATPAEGLLNQMVLAQGGTVSSGHTYDLSFWAKQINRVPSYVQEYQVQWLSASNGVLGGSGVISFNGTDNTWVKISKNGLVAPAGTVEARVSFRFATGAVAGGSGEVFIDDVLLDDGSATAGSPGHTDVLAVTAQPVAKLTWATEAGVSYQPWASPDLLTWTAIPPVITGDGNPRSVTVPLTNGVGFFRLGMPLVAVLSPTGLHTVPSGIGNAIGLGWNASATNGVTGYRIRYGTSSGNLDQTLDVGTVTTATLAGLLLGQTYFISVSALTANGESPAGEATSSAQPDTDSGIVALFNSSTPPEPATTIDTPTALVTRIGDRARDRHAREAIYQAYDHYLTWYWEERTIGIEIIDHVAKGGTGITFNYQTLIPLGAPEFRAFFRGINTVAEYHGNYSAPLVGPNLYSQTLTAKQPENRPLQIGDRVEIEISQFIQAATHGRNNYYGTVMLYIVGQGIVPWEASGELQDSSPLPQTAWLGGKTTLPYQYSNEPEHRFKQTAGNISPSSIQPFMLGRRLHHTDFGDGSHSESGNPVFTEQIGKLGPKFIARSCVECHVNNGRALPPAIGAPMTKSVVKVGSNATGSPHPLLGSVLQPQSVSGPAEGAAVIASYINSSGQYGDGASWSLRKPTYSFQGTAPAYFSVRLTPPLVGMGAAGSRRRKHDHRSIRFG